MTIKWLSRQSSPFIGKLSCGTPTKKKKKKAVLIGLVWCFAIYKEAIIIKILALSESIIFHFLSELEGPGLPMKLIVVPEGPFYN